MKNVKGITLIALVITIIVLIILASVGIYLYLGENGIFNKAKYAKNETIKQTATEKMNLKITNMQIEKYAQEQRMPTLQEFADGLCIDNEIEYVELESKNLAALDKIEVGDASSIFTKLKEYPYEFEIDSSLRLASVDGIQIANNNDEQYQELLTRLSALETELNNTKEKVKTLESKTFYGERVKLLDNSVNIPLYTTATSISNDVTLNNSIENFKYLEIQFDINYNEGHFSETTCFIAVEQLDYNNTNTVNWTNESTIILEVDWANCTSIADAAIWFKDNKTLHYGYVYTNRSDYDNIRIRNIYGIN